MLDSAEEATFWAAAAARGLEFWADAMDTNDGMDVECDHHQMEAVRHNIKRQRPDELPLHQQVKRLCLKRSLPDDVSKKRPRGAEDPDRVGEEKHQKSCRTKESDKLSTQLREATYAGGEEMQQDANYQVANQILGKLHEERIHRRRMIDSTRA